MWAKGSHGNLDPVAHRLIELAVLTGSGLGNEVNLGKGWLSLFVMIPVLAIILTLVPDDLFVRLKRALDWFINHINTRRVVNDTVNEGRNMMATNRVGFWGHPSIRNGDSDAVLIPLLAPVEDVIIPIDDDQDYRGSMVPYGAINN